MSNSNPYELELNCQRVVGDCIRVQPLCSESTLRQVHGAMLALLGGLILSRRSGTNPTWSVPMQPANTPIPLPLSECPLTRLDRKGCFELACGDDTAKLAAFSGIIETQYRWPDQAAVLRNFEYVQFPMQNLGGMAWRPLEQRFMPVGIGYPQMRLLCDLVRDALAEARVDGFKLPQPRLAQMEELLDCLANGSLLFLANNPT